MEGKDSFASHSILFSFYHRKTGRAVIHSLPRLVEYDNQSSKVHYINFMLRCALIATDCYSKFRKSGKIFEASQCKQGEGFFGPEVVNNPFRLQFHI
jgi:hypothetical protein